MLSGLTKSSPQGMVMIEIQLSIRRISVGGDNEILLIVAKEFAQILYSLPFDPWYGRWGKLHILECTFLFLFCFLFFLSPALHYNNQHIQRGVNVDDICRHAAIITITMSLYSHLVNILCRRNCRGSLSSYVFVVYFLLHFVLPHFHISGLLSGVVHVMWLLLD